MRSFLFKINQDANFGRRPNIHRTQDYCEFRRNPSSFDRDSIRFVVQHTESCDTEGKIGVYSLWTVNSMHIPTKALLNVQWKHSKHLFWRIDAYCDDYFLSAVVFSPNFDNQMIAANSMGLWLHLLGIRQKQTMIFSSVPLCVFFFFLLRV